MIAWLVKQFGSKKLTALVAGLLLLVLSAIASHLGIHVEPTVLQTFDYSVAGTVVTYVLAQAHVDASTGGATTTAATIAREGALELAKLLPSQTVGAQVARVVADALADDPVAQARALSALAQKGVTPVTPAPPSLAPIA